MWLRSHARSAALMLIVIWHAVVLASPLPALAQASPGTSDGSGGNSCFLGVICQNPATWLQQTVTKILTDFLTGLVQSPVFS